MGDVVNLRRARKARDRAGKAARATEAAMRHGRTKAQRITEDDAADRAARRLEAHRREAPEDGA